MTGLRAGWGGVVALAVVVSLAACSGSGSTSDDATGGSGEPAGGTVQDVREPTAPPSDLTPDASAEGDEVSVGGVATIRVPAGAAAEGATDGDEVTFRMPGADAQGLPVVQVAVERAATSGVYEQTWVTENDKKLNESISDFVRAPVEWPGSDQSVVITWTEEVALQDGSTTSIEGLDLLVTGADGNLVRASAYAPAGALDGSSALAVVRSLTLG
ncbi:hypothetical protein [Cellulomonas biazotea]|jgi:hypothetical protein|uniref:Lipoprotein n=1 Tax=Cellulomonas biazotea TaxID=1709 RepID=A0A402DN94_9CELL|nr:hypothetical protein [Cellulomonas biazotea]GCE75595.1 hypothetical protein CBZ_06510 [Cellulomonas biazotea]